MDDFNPLDLSAPPKKVTDEQKTTVKEFEAKPTVKRVSMGPLFHSRITRVLALILSVVLFALIGYSAMNYYLTSKDTNNTSSKPFMLQLGYKNTEKG